MSGPTRPGRRRKLATSVVASGPSTNNNSYVYRDENGERLFRVVRGNGKRFHQERFEDGEWKPGIKGVQRVLYNMPAVVDAATHDKVIWECEGEKDADALIAEGLVATTNPGGAGKWKEEYSYLLLGAHRVHIVWDNDTPDPKTGKLAGQEHALQIEASLRTLGIPVRFYRAKEGNDVSDHLAAGYSVPQLVQERPGPPLPPSETNGHTVLAQTTSALPAVYQLALHKLQQHASEHGLPQPRETEAGYEACCPAHDDHSPSLGIRVGDEQPLVVNCQRGCELHEIAEALGIDPREFSVAKLPDYDAATQKRLEFLRSDRNAKFILAGEAAPAMEAPMSNPQRYMTEPPPKYPFTVDDLHITGSNTLVVSKFKAGKSTLMINLFRSLVNVEPFLGHFDVREHVGKIAYMDYEMQKSQFQAWLQAGGELDYDRMVEPWHLRGQSLHFWAAGVREQFVEWLQKNEVKVLIVDTAARAWAGLVENENSNSEILRFTDMLDNVKQQAGVVDLFLVTHMGRNIFVPEGEERARGATRLEDWMDCGWYLTKDENGVRYLRATGRGVDMEAFALDYEPNTHSLLTSGVSKKEHRNQTALQQVVDLISAFDGPPSTTELKDMMSGSDSTTKNRWVLEAETRGLITRHQGKGRTKRCELTEAGKRLHERKINMSI